MITSKLSDNDSFADNVTVKEQTKQEEAKEEIPEAKEEPAEGSSGDEEKTLDTEDKTASGTEESSGTEDAGQTESKPKNPDIEELEPLPTAIANELPDGYTVTTFGGLSLPHHTDFNVEKRDNMITIEVPITPETCETVTIVHEDDTNGVYRLSDKDEIIENAKLLMTGDIYESEGEGDGYTIYRIAGSGFGPDEEKEYAQTDFYIFMEHELYTLSFLTDGADNRLQYTQWEMAFDPSVEWVE